MKDKFIFSAVVLVCLVLVYAWLTANSAAALKPEVRLPGADKNEHPFKTKTQSKFLKPEFAQGLGVPADVPGAWPCFRGSNRDDISAENTPLARSWPARGPAKLWSIAVCQGYAGAAVLSGKVYLLDYDEVNLANALRCLSLADGSEIWRYSYPLYVKSNHGITRTVPAVTEKYVVSLGPLCQVTCLDAQSGEFRWAKDLMKEFNIPQRTIESQWYAGQCPLIDGAKVILAPGNDSLMCAVDCQTGALLWKTANPRRWTMTHASILPLEFHGQRMYVYCGSGGVAGVSAENGLVLWDTDAWRVSTRHGAHARKCG